MKQRSRRRSRFRAVATVLSLALVTAIGLRCRLDRPNREHQGARGGNGLDAGRPAPSTHLQASKPRPPTTTSDHLALGTPSDADPSDDLLLVKPQYALSYNPRRNAANWVSWNLNETHFGSTPRHRGRFLSDASLPAGVYRVRDQDYAGSGYDRGHMVRSEERTQTPEDNAATFLLTNVLPQRHDLNAGPWLRLEEHCQTLAQKEHRELFVVAGGVFGTSAERIGRGVSVPASFFKIVVVLGRGEAANDVRASTRVIAVLMPNVAGILNEGFGRYRTTVDEIEQRTGYDFLSAVPEPIQRAIEARIDDVEP